MDLLADCIRQDAPPLDDLPVLRQDLIGSPVLYLLDTENVLLHCVPGYAKFAGYPLVGAIEVVQIDDSSYLCHRFHPNAHLSAYFGESRLSFLGGSKTNRRFLIKGGQN